MKTTIDLTPTWSAALPLLVHALENGNEEMKRYAKEELIKMAVLADRAVRLISPKE
jgi:hypothetical protein